MKKGIFVGLILLSLALITSCQDDSKGNGVLSVRLTDSPANYEEVLIDVAQVQINTSHESGWQTLEGINAGIIRQYQYAINERCV